MDEGGSQDITLTAEDWILTLLYANDSAPILGKTVFVKQLFVLGKELMPDIEKKFNFYPHMYGPYTNQFERSLNHLINENLVKVTFSNGASPENHRVDYSLTVGGINRASAVFGSLPPEIQHNMTKYKRMLSKLGLFGLLNYVYSNYPEYAVHSKLIKRG